MRIADPSGSRPEAPGTSLSPRLDGLRGRRLAVLDNNKPNARHVVRALASHLESRYETQPPHAASKALASRPVPDEVLVGFRNFDAAIVGVGD